MSSVRPGCSSSLGCATIRGYPTQNTQNSAQDLVPPGLPPEPHVSAVSHSNYLFSIGPVSGLTHHFNGADMLGAPKSYIALQTAAFLDAFERHRFSKAD